MLCNRKQKYMKATFAKFDDKSLTLLYISVT